MATPFGSTIQALWSSLGLGAPRLDARDRAVLTVDGRTVTLALSGDERRIVVSTVIGALAIDPIAAGDQVRRLLRDSAGLILLKRAALRLQPGTGREGSDIIEVQASAPCDARLVPSLTGAIEDVLFLAEAHAGTLTSFAPSRHAQAPGLGAADLEGSLIFRL